jgi:hypothetical protein
MADYWLAPSLVVLGEEINAAHPGRDKRSDGWIGDKRHAGTKSDHNPSRWPPLWAGVVRARDFDNDLAVGRNAQALVDYLASQLGKHPALGSGAYLIYNNRIISTDRLAEGWRPYSGTNPHEGHFHLSVGRSAAAYNSTAPWGITQNGATMLTLKDLIDFRIDGRNLWDSLKQSLATSFSIEGKVDKLRGEVAELAKRPAGAAEPIDYEALAKALLAEAAK